MTRIPADFAFVTKAALTIGIVGTDGIRHKAELGHGSIIAARRIVYQVEQAHLRILGMKILQRAHVEALHEQARTEVTGAESLYTLVGKGLVVGRELAVESGVRLISMVYLTGARRC